MKKKRVLFVCVHNSARSQMAEAFLKKYAGNSFVVESAGLEPGVLNPLAVAAMKELGIDISANKTKSVLDFYRQGKQYEYVIAVCDQSRSGACPVFPGPALRLHWDFSDPAGFTGTWQEKLAQTRIVRDAIQEKVKQFIKECLEQKGGTMEEKKDKKTGNTRKGFLGRLIEKVDKKLQEKAEKNSCCCSNNKTGNDSCCK